MEVPPSPFRPRFSLTRLMIAVAVAGVVFAALRHDIGLRGYSVFLGALTAFGLSVATAGRSTGRRRGIALAVAALSGLLMGAVFLVFGRR